MGIKINQLTSFQTFFLLLFLVLFIFLISLTFQKIVHAAPTVVKTTSGKVFFDDFNRTSIGSGYTAEGVGTSSWSMNANRVRYTSSGAGGQATLKSNNISTSGDKIYEFLFNTSTFNSVAPRTQTQKSDNSNFYWFDSDFGN